MNENFSAQISNLIEKSFRAGLCKERDRIITMRHFGWDGNGGCSLQRTGDEFGLTRERVRQISQQFARYLEPEAIDTLTCVPSLMDSVIAMAPASAQRIESNLTELGLGNDRIEGVIRAAVIFFQNEKYKHIRTIEEGGSRYVILPDMEGSATKITAHAQKICTHVGMVNIEELLDLLPGIPKERALDFIRDVLESRSDTRWLDHKKTWVWLKNAPRNRLITCLHKMLSVFSSITAEQILAGANRYYRKGKKNPQQLSAPQEVIIRFVEEWGEATCSANGIIRKTSRFDPKCKLIELEGKIVDYISKKETKVAREKELENALVPIVDNTTHPKKFNFSIALNYSPLICKGSLRGEYVANGVI